MNSAERIQMATNETESCCTCESICMPIKLLIKHTMYYKAVQTPNIVFEAKIQKFFTSQKRQLPKIMKILIRGGGLHIEKKCLVRQKPISTPYDATCMYSVQFKWFTFLCNIA